MDGRLGKIFDKPGVLSRHDRAVRPDLAGAGALVVGLARTGQAAAEFLLEQGARVTATDLLAWEDLDPRAQALAERGVVLELGRHREETFTQADLIVVSPGVPLTIKPLLTARAKGVGITGEIELASRFIDQPLVAVTGTNGKTTTTSLIGEIFQASGRKVFVGGNIGRPLIEYVNKSEPAEVVVIEVSSFQLETVETLHPAAAVLLNVTPDHLDRHPDFEAYAAAKLRLFGRQGPEDTAVLNADDPVAAGAAPRSRPLFFSRRSRVESGAYVDAGRLVLMAEGKELAARPLTDMLLTGAHNQENVMASVLAASALGVDPAAALAAAARFRGLPHRVELVGEYDGVRYYDDSKGTNVGAVIKSLEGFNAPVILIAGGRDKSGDFRPLRPLIREKVKLLILLGEAKAKMAGVLGGETETVLVGDMVEAVTLARDRAESGDVVLLSPACASFDMFKDYIQRGLVFADLVREGKD